MHAAVYIHNDIKIFGVTVCVAFKCLGSNSVSATGLLTMAFKASLQDLMMLVCQTLGGNFLMGSGNLNA